MRWGEGLLEALFLGRCRWALPGERESILCPWGSVLVLHGLRGSCDPDPWIPSGSGSCWFSW